MRLPRLSLTAVAATVSFASLLGLSAPPAVAVPWAGGPVETVGKIIWDAGRGQIGLCSGAIVDAPNGSVVATAAHCVTSPGEPQPPRRAWFVPAYDHDIDRYREEGWRITSFHTPDDWDVTRKMADILPYDYAFLGVAEKDGRTIQEVHGANRPVFEEINENRSVTALGYPAVDPYDGESLHYCSGPARVLSSTGTATANAGGLLLENCDMTQGSSGGPWIQEYDAASESGTLVGVMSVGSGSGEVIGRPFPAEARALLRETQQ